MTANWSSGANNVTGEVDAGGSSLLNLSLGPDTLGDLTLIWIDFTADLTAGNTLNAIALEIPFDDLPADLTLTVFSPGKQGSSQITTTGGIFVPTQVALLFSSFSGSVDFTSVGRIDLLIEPLLPATDLQISFIESTFIPEPGTALLIGMGLVGLSLHRRRS